MPGPGSEPGARRVNRRDRPPAPLPALTLFLPGLGEPPADGPADALLGDLSLPALIRLMTRGDRVDGPSGGVERALFSLFGVDTGDALPAAALSRLADDPVPGPGPEGAGEAGALSRFGEVSAGGAAPAGALGLPAPVVADLAGSGRVEATVERSWWLRADPVHLRPDLSKLLLFDAESFSLTAAEADALAGKVAPLFEELGAALEVGAPSRWYLRRDAPLDLQTSPLSAVLGQDLRGHRPAGADAPRWQALLTEVEMTLFASPVNQAREERGAPPVNSLWLWGGGGLLDAPSARWSHVWADDVLAAGLARRSGMAHGSPPASAEAWLAAVDAAPPGPAAAGGSHLLVDAGLWRAACYGDVEAWRDGLLALDRSWLAPLVEALSAGKLGTLTVLGGAGPGYCLDRGALRRWWRRSRPVASMLGR